MIILLGGNGYVGGAYKELLSRRKLRYQCPSRSELDLYDVEAVISYLRDMQAKFLINAAGYTGHPNVDACEEDKTNCLMANAILPSRVAEACDAVGVPLGHVSSGCIFTGSRPDGSGFKESDEPNFTFRQNNCSFYSGTKALGEELLERYLNVYIWRLRIPFSEFDGARNYISKLLRYKKLLEATNSISHLGEFTESTLACFELAIPFGTYNVTNPGAVSTRQVVELIQESGVSNKNFEYFESEAEFMKEAAMTPRSNCVLESGKLMENGIRMTPVVECIKRCLSQWKPERLL